MATDTDGTTIDRLADDPVVATAVAVGGVLTLVGVVAPLVAGPEGEFVVFGRNYLHDAVHLLTGLAGLGAGYYAGGRFARTYAVTLGIVYLGVALLGLVMFPILELVLALNAADNVLHFALAFVLLGVGSLAGSAPE